MATNLFFLAFDHRKNFEHDMLGRPAADDADAARLADAKEAVLDGLLRAIDLGLVERDEAGALVDEQYGAPRDLPQRVKAAGARLAMPAERSGAPAFELAYGDDFAAHIERFAPDHVKVLVRYHPDDDAAKNATQRERLATLSRWLDAHGGRLLAEVLVPPLEADLARVGGDADRFDAELRPDLTVRAMRELRAGGVEPAIWKLEGFEAAEVARDIAAVAREGGRDHVELLVLGRAAPDDVLRRWLGAAASAEGWIGFAIGRSVWSEPARRLVAGEIGREEAVEAVARRYGTLVAMWREGSAVAA